MGGSPGQRLRGDLTAAQKDRLRLQTILAEDAGLMTYPDMALGRADCGIADAEFLEFLGLRFSAGRQYDNQNNYADEHLKLQHYEIVDGPST